MKKHTANNPFQQRDQLKAVNRKIKRLQEHLKKPANAHDFSAKKSLERCLNLRGRLLMIGKEEV